MSFTPYTLPEGSTFADYPLCSACGDGGIVDGETKLCRPCHRLEVLYLRLLVHLAKGGRLEYEPAKLPEVPAK